MRQSLTAVLIGYVLCAQLLWADQAGPLVGRVAALPAAHQIDWQTVTATSATHSDTGLQLQFFTEGERGSEAQIVHDLRRERIQVAALSLQSLLPVVPEVSIALAPYIFASDKEAQFVFENYLLNTFDDLLAEQNLKLIQWLDLDWQGIYSTVPLDLMNGSQVWRVGGPDNLAYGQFFAQLGVQFFPVAEFKPRLSARYGFDGRLCNVRTTCVGFMRAAEPGHLLLAKHSYDIGIVVANKHWFDGGTRLQQQALYRALASGATHELTDVAFVERGGRRGRVADLPAAQLRLWQQAGQDLMPRLIDRIGGSSAQVWEIIQTGKRAYAATQAPLETGAAR